MRPLIWYIVFYVLMKIEISPFLPNARSMYIGTSLWTKRCAAFGHTVWGFYYINFGGKLIYTARLWARILWASEAIWAAIYVSPNQQMPQICHTCTYMSSKIRIQILRTKFRMAKINPNTFVSLVGKYSALLVFSTNVVCVKTQQETCQYQ